MKNTAISTYKVTGVMSGTSLDGVDIAHCKFTFSNNRWSFVIEQAETVPYPSEWKKALLDLEKTEGFAFQQTDTEYGFYLGDLVADFIQEHQLQSDFIASHGHTIFHSAFQGSILAKNKDQRLTTQIGAGSSIAAKCSLPVVCDFRSLDVALGGQGAPLVPIGDKLLFGEYDFCMNLGGFANVSYEHESERIAYDICPVNIVMNAVCESIGKDYDDGGALARSGKINEGLLNELNELPFFKLPINSPKSLGKEWVIAQVNPLLKKHKLSVEDTLRTFCEHIALQVARMLNDKKEGKLLVTGGGVYNSFLIERIKEHSSHQLIVPDNKTVNFKEALLFAFLGVLRMRNEVNCLKSVTGALRDNVGGAVYVN